MSANEVESRTKWFPYAVVVMTLLLLYDFQTSGIDSHYLGKPVKAVMPSFKLVDSMSGKVLTEQDLIGTKYVLNVWATWCMACRREHQLLNQIADSGVVVVGLNYKDKPANASDFLNRRGNPFTISLLDHTGTLTESLGALGVPETFIVDNSGMIVSQHVGLLTELEWNKNFRSIYLSLK